PTRSGRIRNALAGTEAAYLISPSPIPPNSNPPRYHPSTISPQKKRYTALLQRPPSTAFESELQTALQESESRDSARKRSLVEMQATTVLTGLYVDRVQQKAEAQAAEKEQPKKKQKLFAKGTPKLLTNDDMIKRVTDFQAAQQQEQAAKDARRKERDEYQKAMDVWKKEDQARKARNLKRREAFALEKAAWEEEVKLARAEKRKPVGEKPKLGLESPIPKPKSQLGAADEDVDGNNEGEGEPS
ncbi:hypothetical protein C8Q76DRAFT_586492, partial [Earliella scabrosa]